MRSHTARFVQLHESDNVAIAITEAAAGLEIDLPNYIGKVRTTVPSMHKIALQEIKVGEPIHKFGSTIGFASQNIKTGEHVHTQNCVVRGDMQGQEHLVECATISKFIKPSTFMGFERPSGNAGTRNYVLIVPTVNCAVTVSEKIKKQFEQTHIMDRFLQVDGVQVLAHQGGCGGMSVGSMGFKMLKRVLEGYVNNANVAAVLFVGLGCEVMQVSHLLRNAEKPVQSLVIQETSGTEVTIEKGVRFLSELMGQANQVSRKVVPASKLTLALQCGGSDALSGITCNPALGAAVDVLVAQGGTAILSETTEVVGAEKILLSRAKTKDIQNALNKKIDWWQRYAALFGGTLDNNPSPGNKAGGLTTILEKSLGAVAKAGTPALSQALDYAEPVTVDGLVFMDSPGYDPASVTGQIASGANLVAFTTGRGSAFGSKPAPTVKLGSNSALYLRQSADIDINCGKIIDNGISVEEMGAEVFRYLLDVASGMPSKSEQHGYGDHEFVPWHVGPVL